LSGGRTTTFEPIEPKLKAPVPKRLKLQYDNLLSSFAFNYNLRRYTVAITVDSYGDVFVADYLVCRSRLTP